MVKNKLLIFALFIFSTLVLAGFASAAATISSVYLNDTDNFYSNYTNNSIVHVVAVVTGMTDTGVVLANFSNFVGTIDCGSGSNTITLTNGTHGGSIYNGSCNVGDEAAVSNFALIAPIIVTAVNETPPTTPPAIDTNTSAMLYNMTSPTMPLGCQRFGNMTTNFARDVLNFSSVNFIIQIEMNGSCLTGPGGGSSPWNGYQQVMMMNFSSLNMSSQTIGNSLAGLKDALQVNITPPNGFGTTRIYVNETAFSELNTNTTITLNNIPFAAIPDVLADNPSELLGQPTWTLNTPWNISIQAPVPRNISVPNGNLRFTVGGFTGYNATDDVKPIITINSPSTISNKTAVAYNVSVNGTGTSPSQIIVNVDGTNYIYNSSVNDANCTNASAANQEVFNCYKANTLADGNHTISITAYDFGGNNPNGPGNVNSTSVSVLVDSTLPLVSYNTGTTANMSNGTASTGITFVLSVVEANLKNISYNVYNSTGLFIQTNTTTTSAGFTGLPDGNYSFNATVEDLVGNKNSTSTRTVTIDSTIPFVAFGNGADSDGLNLTRTNIVINATASDAHLASLTVNLYNSSWVNTTVDGSPNYINVTSLADGVYYMNATVVDYSGNVNATAVRTVTIDTTAPVLSLGSSATQTSLTLSISATDTTGLNGTCTVDRSGATVSGLTINESGLSCGTYYPYNVSCYDYTGHLGSINQSFQTSACSTSTTNPNADSTYASSFWIMTYTADSESFSGAGFNKLLSKYERIKVLLSGEAHFVGVTNVSSNSVTINVSSDPQSATLNVGETKKFDVNSDGYYDVGVKLNDMENSKANLTVMYLHEKMAETMNNLTTGNNPAAGNGTNPPTTLTTNQTGTQGTSGASAVASAAKNWRWIVIGVLVIIVVLVIIFWKKIWFWLSNLKHQHN